MKIATADSKIRSSRNSSFISRGSDNYDHRGLNKARRFQNQAVIAEQLEPEFVPQMPVYRYVVELDYGVSHYFENKIDAETFHKKESFRIKENQILACLATDDDWESLWESMPTIEYRELAKWEIDQ